MANLAIFASGGGSNAECIINYFKASTLINVKLVVSNKPNAGVLGIADKKGIDQFLINTKDAFIDGKETIKQLKAHQIDFVILAGFLWLIPSVLVDAFPNKILNIHPSLLPKYGGKGMYGIHVHQAVKENKEIESGLTIHLVNEKFDDGDIIFQSKCQISDDMFPDQIGSEVLKLEHRWYARVIESYILNFNM